MQNESCSIRLKPTHGTATPVFFPKFLPEDKLELELFIGKSFTKKLGLSEESIRNNNDDSEGNHDLLLSDGIKEIGIQLTELTSSFKNRRESIRKIFLDKLIEEINKQKLKFDKPKIVFINFKYRFDEGYSIPLKPKKLKKIVEEIENSVTQETQTDEYRLYIDDIPMGNTTNSVFYL